MGGTSSSVTWRQAWGTPAEDSVRQALATLGLRLAELASQRWDPSTSTIGGVRDYECSFVGSAGPSWCFFLLHLNAEFYEDLAVALSAAQPEPVLVFTEFDQAVWGYSLCHGGRRLDTFWSDPEYVGVDPSTCSGDPDLVATTFRVEPASIAGYLMRPVDGLRVHADDVRTLDDHWVRVDFMRRLGILYPDLTPQNGRHVLVSPQ
jgi:hypothetical protein